ncbi:hypothetical protein [Euzebya sp.]|uniref:hypothetical protein n=1 Tax=Euzebya sp. TaxID=1971409 RepID=UPI0035149FFB
MIEQLKAALAKGVDGLDDRQAEQAARTAVDFMKDRLPPPIADRLEELVDGDGEGDVDFGQLGSTIKGFLGR